MIYSLRQDVALKFTTYCQLFVLIISISVKILFQTSTRSFYLYKIQPEQIVQETIVGHGGALVEAITLNRRVVGSTPALAAM